MGRFSVEHSFLNVPVQLPLCRDRKGIRGHAALLFFKNFFFTLQYCIGFTILQHESFRHGCTRVPNPEPPSHVSPHTIPLGHPSAPAPSILYPASNLDWRFVSYMILYMFQWGITSWEIDGETVETVSDFIFLGSKITADGDHSHEIKRCLLEGKL